MLRDRPSVILLEEILVTAEFDSEVPLILLCLPDFLEDGFLGFGLPIVLES